MEDNEADKQIRLARILLNLGHSYLHTVDIESSEEESGESESEQTESEETEGEEKEVQTKFKASKQQNIEEEEDQFDKQHHDKVIKQQELKKKTNLEDIPQQFYRDIQQKSYNNLPVEADTEKHEIEKEVANKSHDKKHEVNIDLPKEFNNTIQQKLECGVELIGEVQNEFSKKQEKLHTDDQPKNDKDKDNECNKELIEDSENEIQIQLLIEAPPMPGVDVKLYLEVQVDSGCQLDIKKEEVLGEKQKNVDKEHQKAVDKNIEHTDHKDRQAVNKNVQTKFDEVNISQDIEEDIQDKINKESKQNLEEENNQPESNENLEEQYDNEVQHDVKELQQEDYEETMDTNHKRILQEIESLIYDFQNRKNEEEECDELTAIRIAKITKEIEELEIDMEQKRDEELEREYNDEFKCLFSSLIKEKFLEKLLLSFNEDAAPYYKRIENLLSNYIPTKLDTINDKILIDPVHSKPHKDLKERSDVSNGAFEEIQEESDKRREGVEKRSNDEIYYFEEVPEESNIEMGELEDEEVQAVSDIENEDETLEESDVDVEGVSNPDDEVTGGLDWNLQIESEINEDKSDGQSLEESDEELEELNDDVNIVTEIVYDYEVEEEAESSSIEELSTIEESASTDDEFNSTEIEQRNEEIQQKIDKEGQVKCIGSIHELQGDVKEKSDNDKPQKFEDLQLQMEIENIQDLDEIPLKLKIQQEELEEKLHQQMKTFQEEFYKNSKLEYDKEQQLKGNTLIDPIYDREQKLFYKIKGDFLKTTDKYKDLAQQKMIEALQQKVDEKQLLEMKEFPEEFVEPNIEIEDLNKEVLQLQRECAELEPEFSYNIPLVVDDKPSNDKTKKVKYNLYDKLFEIHKKKLCFFADSKEWPEKYLYPSCLLDELFDDPSEVNPNVFVITLYSVDIGYSIKITMNKNEPPVETFYSYADDSILDFVEREQLPPCLLDLFDKARPRLFYNGRVIAEIHNKYHGEDLTRVYRILLHPHNLSIQSDVDRIIAKCSPAYCSYEQRLKIESQLILRNFPVMCIDSSPIAGLTVHLQNQLLSRRTISLNPLKVKNNDSSNLEMNLSKKLQEDRLNESQNESSELMKDTASDNTIHHLLWKFEFRIHTFKIIKLYVFVITETLEYSMLLCMNSIVPRSKKMRFKINLETNKLKAYIDVILEFLKKNINPDTLVVRRYKSDDKSVPQSTTCVPSLLNDNVYEPSSTDICKFLDELLEFIPQIEPEETDETKRCLYYGVKSKKKDINSGSTKRLPKNQENSKDQKRKKRVQSYELKKLIPRQVEPLSTNKISVDSKSLKSSTIPKVVSLGLKSLPTKSLNPVKPLLTGSKSNALLDDRTINVVHKELDSNSAKDISLVSSPMTILPTVSSHITVVSLEQSFTDAALPPKSNTATIISLAPRYNKTIFSSAACNTDYRLASKNLERFEDHSETKDIKSKPVIQSKTDHTKCMGKNNFSLKTSFDNINSRPPLHNFVRRPSSCDDEMEKNIKVLKHVHRNGICLKGPEYIIKKEGLTVAGRIIDGRFSDERNPTHYQETKQLNNDLTTNIDSLSNLQVTSPNPVITLVPSSLNKFNNQDQMNDISFQEINYTSSSSTENIKSVKRKRSS
ncbi:golgin subfamily A member 4 [Acyrthosiphon pisum]|uniref:Uncharacterized protein n=1 Tax=Acyrthosiphon pisum TaxID=7029 RepID=A0A8R1VYA7_ACYPI|nr:golgin subfamily A member 4 [Acyrthosiphon pisum]|eukprot:XP_001942883.2 PREDICTED: golgin subfamily A member 4 [Acyrthosiphon pisum]